MRTLLLVEDQKILRENTRELLEIHGYKCLTAINGREGLSMAVNLKPDLIICDIMLPKLTGYQVKEELNKSEQTAYIPFIFFSAKIEAADFQKGLELGSANFITKPYRISELIRSIELSIANKQHYRRF